jgi:hypothetical protein
MNKHLLAFATALTVAATASPSHAIEEPAFQVLQKLDGFELRQYAPYVVAEVVVSGPADEAGNAGFRLLAGYIFGKNKGEKKLAMTAPVTQSAATAPPSSPASASAKDPTPTKLEMTAPVTQAAVAGGYLVQFVLPKDVTLESAPEPLDARVKLRLMPAQKVAVITYSGFWSEANYAEHLQLLKDALGKAQMAWSGEPVLSRYDPPFMPWFLRRNEIWLAVN